MNKSELFSRLKESTVDELAQLQDRWTLFVESNDVEHEKVSRELNAMDEELEMEYESHF